MSDLNPAPPTTGDAAAAESSAEVPVVRAESAESSVEVPVAPAGFTERPVGMPAGPPATAYPPVPAPVAAAPVAPVAPRRRRRTALITVGAVVVVAAAVGVGHGALRGTAGGGHAAAQATPWTRTPGTQAEKAYGVKPGGAHYGSLRDMLLPVPAGWIPGEDVEQYGNDAVLDANQAASYFLGPDSDDDDAAAGKKIADELHFEGAGVRTYQPSDGSESATVVLFQARNQVALQKFFTSLHSVGSLSDTHGSKTLKVAGYPDASCHTDPGDGGTSSELSGLECEAVQGDLLVGMSVDGPLPLDPTKAVDLYRKQLDRIKAPGEAV